MKDYIEQRVNTMRDEQIAELQKKLDKVTALAVSALYFDDNSDYGSYLWQILALTNKDARQMLEDGAGSKVYEKYVERIV